MIDFNRAIDLIKAHAWHLGTEKMNCSDALGFHLAHDIFAPLDLPLFANSAVDGFAVRRNEVHREHSLPIVRSIRAVAQEPWALAPNSCARIMTGAPLPLGADAVIMQENAIIKDERVSFLIEPAPGEHIRCQGEDLKEGAVVAKRGTRLTPQLLAVLLGCGIAQIRVFKFPTVSIICTGDELVRPPQKLNYGQVYFLVGEMLKAQCRRRGLQQVRISLVKDEQKSIESAITQSLDADLLLLTGGMSVGKHDLGVPALSECGVERIFYQGLWRPGKPLFFGRSPKSLVFGLPGNPVASFVCFRVFVETLLDYALSDCRDLPTAQLMHDVEKKAGVAYFARAKVNEVNELSILPEQGSHQIFALSQANALCLVEEGSAIVKAEQAVKYYPI